MKIYSNGEMVEFGGGGGSSGDVYSTEEKVVGRWIDGKPLYKRSWIFVTPSVYSAWQAIGAVVADIDELVETVITFISTDGVKIQLPYYDTMAVGAFSYGADGIRLFLNHPTGDYFKSRPGRVTLLYTKTTDQSTIELPAALTAAPAQADYKAASQSTAAVMLDAGMHNEEV